MTAENSRFRILRVFQQGMIKRIIRSTASRSQNAGNHAGNGIGNDHSRHFAACHDEITDGNRFIGQILFYPVIHAFIMTTQQNELVIRSQLTCLGLIKGRAGRSHEDDTPPGHIPAHRFYGCKQRACLHQHAAATAVDRIVYHAVPVIDETPGIGHIQLQKPLCPCAANDAMLIKSLYKFRK